jgi:uncharacterized protein (TIGR04222 family)
MSITPFAAFSIMHGPTFLVLFAVVIVVVLTVCRARVRRLDTTSDLPPMPVPKQPNAYDIAYLRGGRNEVVRVLIFDLIQRGHLLAVEQRFWCFSTGHKLVANSEHPDLHQLSEVEQAVLQCFASPQSPRNVFRSLRIPEIVAEWCDEIDNRLCDEGLLTTPGIREQASTIRWAGSAVIGTLGGVKLLAALVTGHTNVGFLILMGGFALFMLPVVATPPRVSSRGLIYLLGLQQRYERWKTPAEMENGAGQHGVLVLSLALFGATVLRGTSYEYFLDMFQQSALGGVWWVGGCGGGGFGGGGCGGCGGGGCGGCGGGGG